MKCSACNELIARTRYEGLIRAIHISLGKSSEVLRLLRLLRKEFVERSVKVIFFIGCLNVRTEDEER